MPEEAGNGPPFDRRLKLAIGVLTASVLAILAALRTADLVWRRDQALEAGERRAANLALISSEFLLQTFESADASLRQLAVHGRRVGGPSASPADWGQILAAAKAGLNGIGSLSVLDAEGTIRHSTQGPIVGQSRRDQYLFQRLSSTVDDVLAVNTPFRGLGGGMIIPLGRRLSRDDGRFDGVVAATLIPAELRDFFKTVDVGRDGVVWIFHPDGLVLFREPSEANPIGEAASGNPVFDAARRAGAGGVRGPARPGGPALISAFRAIPEPPLIAAVSLGEAEVLSEWRREVAVSAAVLLFLGLGTAAVVALLFRQIDARATAERALSRAQRLEAIGQLTGGVAHDFNNLLTVILGNVDRLRRAGGAPRIVQAAEQIEQAATRAADLTRRLLVFARRQPLQPRLVDLNELVRGLQPLLARLLEEDVTLKMNLAASPCVADVDPVQTETALMNLCVNARDAMPGGGLLVIETATTVLDERYARLNADATPGRYVTIAVSDTGAGIRPEDVARVFEPFFTTKGPGKGTGLGLSMVYGFVKQSAGHVKVYSEVGHGTAVRMYFPEAGGKVATAAAPAAARAQGGGETVLLVEDEEGVRALATEMLTELGYRVIAAADGAGALALARAHPRIDLLFTDVVLPAGMNGRQLADELARQRPGLPVLYASGYSEDVIQQRGRIEPGLRLLLKPYNSDQLARAMRDALSRDRPGR